ncbi:MAG TPA: hypothetical protein VF188_09675 [Longimicrobiales bacterium]
MFTTTTMLERRSVGVVEVRVRHEDDDTEGALLGYFPPDVLPDLARLLGRETTYFADTDSGPSYDKPPATQFVVSGGRVYYEMIFGV